MVFCEDQTIEDIEKVEKTSTSNDSLRDLDPVSLKPLPDPNQNNVDDIAQNGYQHQDEQQGIVDNNAPTDEIIHDQLQAHVDPPRRSTRDRRPSTQYLSDEYVLLIDGGECKYYEEAKESDQKQQWIDAMEDEMKPLHDNCTFELVLLPKGKKALKNRWIYSLKQEENSSHLRYKARLVVKGYSQRKEIDFEEIFSLVVNMSSITIVLGLAARLD